MHGENHNYELISFQHKCNACHRAKARGNGKGKGAGKGKGRANSATPEESGDEEKEDPDGESGYVDWKW